MTPQRHPPDSVRARDGFCVVWYDDATRQDVVREAFPALLHATEAARRASRCFIQGEQLEAIPLTLTVAGLHGERHAIDLTRVQQVSEWPPAAVLAHDADAALYEDDEEKEPWQG